MIKGSCLCGGVTFEIAGSVSNGRYCHCEHCRKFAGTAPAAWGIAPADGFELTSPDINLRKYDRAHARIEEIHEK